MEASEAKPASRRVRLWGRLSDPDTPPRRWWYPPSSRRKDTLRIPEAVAARQAYRAVVQSAHEKFSETVRLAMLSLLGFALFCLLITFSTPDSSLLVANPTIKTPFADVQVSFQSFLILAPFLLIVVTLYLHIFYWYWLDLETDLQHLALSRESSEPSVERLPTLFSLNHRVPRVLTAVIFYWLGPLVLLAITWKAAARVEWGVPLALFTGLVTLVLVFLSIRRRLASRRRWNILLWVWMGLIIGGMAAITVQFMVQLSREREHARQASAFDTGLAELVHAMVVVPQWLPRPLNIVRTDLKGKWLAAVNLRDAYASFANLQDANLQDADLRAADLENAQLPGAILRGADFRAARLQFADLQGADLRAADLRAVNLRFANLAGADLRVADLQGTDLRGAILQRANLRNARLDRADLRAADLEKAQLPGAILRGADLQGTDLRGANLRSIEFADFRFHPNITFSAKLERAASSGAVLRGSSLEDALLRGAKIPGANLKDALLQGADLQDVDLQEVEGLTEEQIQWARTNEHTKLPPYLKIPRPAKPGDAAPPQRAPRRSSKRHMDR